MPEWICGPECPVQRWTQCEEAAYGFSCVVTVDDLTYRAAMWEHKAKLAQGAAAACRNLAARRAAEASTEGEGGAK